jgi:pyruvate dehydrogenase E2 component (dihydrolipoamide acetyltransferase)/2-oxoisovalerate dehydrogenase E2 component (dihydrolipoyl transacylase)
MDFPLPQIGEGVYEAELVRWLVRPGQTVRPGQGLMEVMTDKATMEVPAPFAGTVVALLAEPGTNVTVGRPVLSYTPAAATVPTPAATPTPSAPRDPGPSSPNGHGDTAGPRSPLPPAAPSVRHLARKLGLDLAAVRGTGPAGRILLEDVTAAAGGTPPAAEKPAEKAEKEPRFDVGRPGTRVKVAGVRKKIAEHMVKSATTVPHFTCVDECDVTELVRLRDSLKEPLARKGVKLTYLAFIVKAAALALKDVPVVNASLDDAAGEIVYHDTYHVGVAVAAPTGLVVPVVRDAHEKDVPTIAQEIERLGTAARLGRLKPEELRGGTFTVTSIGGVGGLIATPIVNWPEVGILGVGKVIRRPVYDDAGRVHPADLLYLSMSFDHRVVDGAIGAVFGNAVIRRLTHPARLLLSGPWA